MSKRDITVNRPELTDQQALKHKDFDQVLSQFAGAGSSMLPKLKLLGGIAGAVVLVGAVAWFAIQDNAPETKTVVATPAAPEMTIQPDFMLASPIAALELGFEEYTVNSTVATRIKTVSGTELAVPANAFVDNNGNAVAGKIALKYRERNSPLALFLGGIPMVTEEESGQVMRQSAGLVEVLASQHGKRLALKSGASISVTLASAARGEDFGTYSLDATGKRSYLGPELTAAPAATHTAANTPNQQLKKPQKPRAAKRNQFTFGLEINPAYAANFPEMAEFENVLFVVNEELTPFNAALYEVDWDEISVSKSETKNHYDLTLIVPDTAVKVTAYQAFNGADYNAAMKAYEASNKAYLASKTTTAPVVEEVISQPENRLEGLSVELLNTEAKQAATTRFMQLNSLGTNALEKELVLSEYGIPYQLTFTNQAGTELSFSRVYIAEQGLNTVTTYRSGAVRCNPKQPNIIWLLTADGKIAVSENTRLTGAQTQTLAMKVMEHAEGLRALKAMLGN